MAHQDKENEIEAAGRKLQILPLKNGKQQHQLQQKEQHDQPQTAEHRVDEALLALFQQAKAGVFRLCGHGGASFRAAGEGGAYGAAPITKGRKASKGILPNGRRMSTAPEKGPRGPAAGHREMAIIVSEKIIIEKR